MKKMFWTWDHSTNWCLHAAGAQNCGVANEYAKYPELFEMDYKRNVDFCSEHGIDAIGIVGMLRDKHGGIESARRLCDYANKKGVTIYMIAGLYAYGGIYYEGDHKYNLDKFFEKNPECMGINEDGSPIYVHYKGKHGYKIQPQGCSTNKLLNEYVLESLDWVFREMPELGGIQMESGDSGVCQCPTCKARRSTNESPHLSIADMAGVYPYAVETINRVAKDKLLICETYSHFLDEPCKFFDSKEPNADLKKLLEMPESVYWQWKCDERLKDDSWPTGAPMLNNMKKFNHVMRAHSGSQWWGAGRASFAVERIRKQCQLSYDSGLSAVSMFGEYAPFHVNAEFNYLAMTYFADHPHATTEDYIRDVMAPRLGGEELGAMYYEFAPLVETDMSKIPEAAQKIAAIMPKIKDYETLRRWQYLASYLNGYYWEDTQAVASKAAEDSDKIGDEE